MEESQNQPQQVQDNFQPQGNGVSFPTVGNEKKNGGAKTLLIIGILVLVGVLGYVIYKSASSKSSEDTDFTQPTPYENTAAPTEVPVASPSDTPSSSPSASVDKTKIKIQVQNGTGITGEAAYLQDILKGIGYSNITVGNSATQDAEDTQVSFGSSVPASVVTEITGKLSSTYQTVTKTASTSTSYDIVIVTGLKKGSTPKPTATPAE